MSGEEVSTIGKDFDLISTLLKQIMHRVSNSAVVIHYIHSAPTVRPDSRESAKSIFVGSS